jgi:hypothetical protein
VSNDIENLNHFRKIMDILEPIKSEYMNLIINPNSVTEEYTMLKVDGELKNTYFDFKKEQDEQNHDELAFLNKSDNFLKPNDKGSTRIFKINKETLEREYNMTELDLLNYAKIDFDKLKKCKKKNIEIEDIAVKEYQMEDTEYDDHTGGMSLGHLKTKSGTFEEEIGSKKEFDLDEYLGKRVPKSDEFDTIEELKKK